MPMMLQVTAVFVVLATVAVNCCVAPARTCAVGGVTDTAMAARTVTVAVLDFVGSATEVAVTKTWAGLGAAEGAV